MLLVVVEDELELDELLSSLLPHAADARTRARADAARPARTIFPDMTISFLMQLRRLRHLTKDAAAALVPPGCQHAWHHSRASDQPAARIGRRLVLLRQAQGSKGMPLGLEAFRRLRNRSSLSVILIVAEPKSAFIRMSRSPVLGQPVQSTIGG